MIARDSRAFGEHVATRIGVTWRFHAIAPGGKDCIVIITGEGSSMAASLYHGTDIDNVNPRMFVCRTTRRTVGRCAFAETIDEMIARLLGVA